jgi:hypothetical protein
MSRPAVPPPRPVASQTNLANSQPSGLPDCRQAFLLLHHQRARIYRRCKFRTTVAAAMSMLTCYAFVSSGSASRRPSDIHRRPYQL